MSDSTPRKTNWKTTTGAVVLAIAGILTAVGGFLSDGGLDFEQVTTAVIALGAAFGLSFARDKDVTSEGTSTKDKTPTP